MRKLPGLQLDTFARTGKNGGRPARPCCSGPPNPKARPESGKGEDEKTRDKGDNVDKVAQARSMKAEGKSLRHIAGELKVGKSTVARWLHRPARKRAELALVSLPLAPESEVFAQEQAAADLSPAVTDSGAFSRRLLAYAYRTLRRLEGMGEEASYRELVGGMKVAGELAAKLAESAAAPQTPPQTETRETTEQRRQRLLDATRRLVERARG